MVGNIGAHIDKVFHSMSETYLQQSSATRRSTLHSEQVKAFVDEFLTDGLFATVPNRQHHAFPNYEPNLTIKDASKMKSLLLKYSQKLDMIRDIAF